MLRRLYHDCHFWSSMTSIGTILRAGEIVFLIEERDTGAGTCAYILTRHGYGHTFHVKYLKSVAGE